jgi:putative transposase
MTTYFITICTHMQQNLFQREEIAELMVATFVKYRDAGEFELHEYVVMPNHVHLLVSLNGEQKLGRVIQLIKGGFSHALREHGITLPAVWQQRYHDRRVRDAGELAEFSQYIRQNPVRRGLVKGGEEYPYSSAANRVGVAGLKPLSLSKSSRDANLKVRSTARGDAELKVNCAVDGDRRSEIRSTVSNRESSNV